MRKRVEDEVDPCRLQRGLDHFDPAVASVAPWAYLDEGGVARALHRRREVHLHAIHADAVAAADPDHDLVGWLREVTRSAAGSARTSAAPEPPGQCRAGADERKHEAGVAVIVG